MVDEARSREFARALVGIYSGAVLTQLIGVGYETGLFDAIARGRATSAELAERAQLEERYVREWLGAEGVPDRPADHPPGVVDWCRPRPAHDGRFASIARALRDDGMVSVGRHHRTCC